MTAPTLIGITGLAGAGKDTVAALLSMVGYRRYAFADELRREVVGILRCAESPKDLPAEWGLESLFRVYRFENLISELQPSKVWEKPTSVIMRSILQKHGSEYRRAQDPDYWVKKFVRAYGDLRYTISADVRVAVTDVRFLNEANCIKQLGGRIWRIIRPDTEQMNHISETEQQQIEVDATIVNDGSVVDLAEKVKTFL